MRTKLHILWGRYHYIFLEVLFLIILSCVPLLWFRPGHIVVGLDSGYPIDYIQYFFQRLYTWLGSHNFGIDMTFDIGSVPYNALPALIQTIGVSYYNVQKVLFVGWFGAILFSIYSLLLYLHVEKNQWVSRLSGTIIYAFSFHLYSFWLQGEQYILASYVLLPLVTLVLLRFIRNKSPIVTSAILLNCVYFFLSSGGVHGIVFLGPVLVTSSLLFLYFFLFERGIDRGEYVRRLVVLVVVSLGIYVCFNAYFLIPFLATSIQFDKQVALSGGLDGIVGWTNVISTFTSFSNLFRLYGDNNWYSSSRVWSYAFLTNPVLIIYSFVFPILSFLAPVLATVKKERIIIVFFILLALCGLFLSAGTHPPLGFLFILIMKWVPGFVVFRSAYYKFIPVVYLSYSVLIGTTAYYLLEYVQQKKRFFVGLVFVGSLLAYHYPFFQSANFESNQPFTTMVKVPEYVHDFARFLNSYPNTHRTLVVPPAANLFNYKAYTWGYWGLYPIFPLFTEKGFVQNDSFANNEYENVIVSSLYTSLRRKDFQTFVISAKLANIRFILLTADMAKDFVMSPSEDPTTFKTILDDTDTFTLIWNRGPWKLYEIRNVDTSKMNAYNSIVWNKGQSSGIIGLLYEKFIPFISDIPSPERPYIPIQTEFNTYPCISCHVIDDTVASIVSSSRINPNSIFYDFKTSREPTSNPDHSTKQRLDRLIGLSYKRLSEISSLNDSNIYSVVSNSQWLKAADLLSAYWSDIQKIYKDSYDNSLDHAGLIRLAYFIDYEYGSLRALTGMQNLPMESKFVHTLTALLQKIIPIKDALHDQVTKIGWSNEYTYDVSNYSGPLYIYPHSLPKDLDNNSLYPTQYTLNGEVFDIHAKNLPYLFIPFSKASNIMRVRFDVPNVFEHSTTVSGIPGLINNTCIMGSIHNYSGLSTYLIKANVNDDINGTMYIKRHYNVMKTADYNPPKQNTFYADVKVTMSTADTGQFQHKFAGSSNDWGADVYFCTTGVGNPYEFFHNITITEWFQPIVYSYKNVQTTSSQPPQITYRQIDPTKYIATVSRADAPYILSLSERYSPLWEAKVDTKVLSKHFRINEMENGWYVDQKGSYDIIISFSSQKLFLIGLIITGISVLGVACSYIIVVFKRK